jgi:hypothetical protein
MCPIQNYLLSLGLTEYRQSILQIVKLAEAVDHSIANNSEFATAALAWVEQQKRCPTMINKRALIIFLPLQLQRLMFFCADR